jgi:predicted nucleic acid-binding protein
VIAVDTSVWVAAQRKPAGREAATLGALLEADDVLLPLPVRVELLSGIARKDRKAFTRALAALPVVIPTEETWRLVESWVVPAADAGHRFAVTDLVVGALATEAGALVWSLDGDFERMAQIGLIRLYG